MSQHQKLAIFLTFIATLLTTQNAFAFRCSGGLIAEGDSKISVLKKCGEPNWIDRWGEGIVNYPDTDFEHRLSRINERWIYNPGPTQFMRIITFLGSKVSSIETGSRGFTNSAETQRCNFDVFSLGTTSVEIASRCGKPDLTDQRIETFTNKISDGRQQITVSVDEWTYNLGPTRFMRILTFRNGDLAEVKTGEKGFNQ